MIGDRLPEGSDISAGPEPVDRLRIRIAPVPSVSDVVTCSCTPGAPPIGRSSKTLVRWTITAVADAAKRFRRVAGAGESMTKLVEIPGESASGQRTSVNLSGPPVDSRMGCFQLRRTGGVTSVKETDGYLHHPSGAV